MFEWLVLLFFLSLPPLMAGVVSYRGACWCLRKGHPALRLLLILVLAAAAAGTGYGLLRLSGLLLLPGDNTLSWNDFDASWRDDGVRYLQIFAGPLGGIIAARLSCKRDKAQSA